MFALAALIFGDIRDPWGVIEAIIWLQQYTTPAFFTLVAVAWIYKEVTMGVCHSSKRLDGKVVIVTGTIMYFEILFNEEKLININIFPAFQS